MAVADEVHEAGRLSEREVHRRNVQDRRRQRQPAGRRRANRQPDAARASASKRSSPSSILGHVLEVLRRAREEIDACPSVGWIPDFGDPQAVLDVPFYGKPSSPTGNSNWGQVNDPEINAAMEAAELVVGVQARARAWAQDRPETRRPGRAIPFDWDKQPIRVERRRAASAICGTSATGTTLHVTEVGAGAR